MDNQGQSAPSMDPQTSFPQELFHLKVLGSLTNYEARAAASVSRGWRDACRKVSATVGFKQNIAVRTALRGEGPLLEKIATRMVLTFVTRRSCAPKPTSAISLIQRMGAGLWTASK